MQTICGIIELRKYNGSVQVLPTTIVVGYCDSQKERLLMLTLLAA